MQEPYVVRTFKGHRDVISSLSFNSNVTRMASSSADASICVWNLRDDTQSFKLVGHKGSVNDVQFSPSGSLLASCSQDTTIKIWQARADGSFSTLRGHQASVNCMDFSMEGTHLLSGGSDMQVLLWDIKTGQPVLRLQGHEHSVNDCKFSLDRKIAVSCGEDGLAKVWDIEKGEEILTFEETSPITCIQFHPDGSCIGTGSNDGALRIYDLRSKSQISEFKCHVGWLNSFDFHPNVPLAVTGGQDARIRIVDLGEGKLRTTLSLDNGATSSVKFSPEGDYFGVGGENSSCQIWKTNIVDLKREKIPRKSQNLATLDHSSQMTRLAPKSHVQDSYAGSLRQMTNLPKNVDHIYNNKQAVDNLRFGYDASKRGQADQIPYTGEDDLEDVEYKIKDSLQNKITKITSSMEAISNTLMIMNARVENNEKLVDGVVDYFSEKYGVNMEEEIFREVNKSSEQAQNCIFQACLFQCSYLPIYMMEVYLQKERSTQVIIIINKTSFVSILYIRIISYLVRYEVVVLTFQMFKNLRKIFSYQVLGEMALFLHVWNH